jgi:hypothetical protein
MIFFKDLACSAWVCHAAGVHLRLLRATWPMRGRNVCMSVLALLSLCVCPTFCFSVWLCHGVVGGEGKDRWDCLRVHL